MDLIQLELISETRQTLKWSKGLFYGVISLFSIFIYYFANLFETYLQRKLTSIQLDLGTIRHEPSPHLTLMETHGLFGAS